MYHQRRIHVYETLPPLAWLADLTPGAISIKTGPGVQIGETEEALHLIEGAWNGPFGEFGFTRAETLFGSGLTLQDGRALLAAPSHTLEALYLCERKGSVVASNSLTFLLTHENIRLPAGQGVWQALLTMSKGLLNQGQILFDDGCHRIQRFISCNVEVASGRIRVLDKPAPPKIASYSDYSTYLHAICRAVLDNAADTRRTRPYAPLATVSKGYDSSACAAVMAANGCQTSVTIAASRRGESDSGREVSEALGMRCLDKPRPAVSEWQNAEEAEFLASGCGGDSVFLSFSKELPGHVLSTGFFGDQLWDVHSSPTTTLTRDGTSGIGLTEFRLRTDFIHAPLSFIAALRNDDLHRIGQSDDMRPYWASGRYNKPIARRLLETAGVPGTAFGQTKQAVMFMMSTQEKLMSPSLQRVRDDFMRREMGPRTLFLSRLHDAPRKVFAAIWKVFGRIPKRQRSIISKIGSAGRVLAIRLDQAYMRLWPFPLDEDALFLASVEKVSARYSIARPAHSAVVEPAPGDTGSEVPVT